MAFSSNFPLNKWAMNTFAYAQSILQALFFILIIGLLGFAWWSYQNTVFVMQEPRVESSPAVVTMPAPEQPLSYYTDMAEQRNIFRFSTDATTGVPATEVITIANQDLAGRYIVQGIVIDGDPMAIIKDIQTNKTHFLHRSEIMDGIRLVDIKENRVILDRGGETMELIKK